jgi:hexosaminidase
MPQGIFRGIQTLIQALPPAIENTEKTKANWSVPCGKIQDKPSYAHRGAMLDVARHFFGMDDVKRYIDFIAAYKMNVLHLHLTDDQGWRIEIKSYPNLTTHGGSTEVGGGKGGFFTQDQYTEIVNYAAERFITVIPEIDMPGHTNAATASYGELRCDNKATELYTGIDVGFSTLCVRKQETWNFVDSVIRELAAITPGPYIHIGGDESHATKKPDYVYFINKAQEIVHKYDKQMVGWDEVATADFKPNSIAQYWAKAENAQLAVQKGGKLIMSPARKSYMDMQYDSTTRIGLHWAAYIEVDSGYIWDLETIEEGIPRENILGIETPLWSETTENMADIEYLVFPRFLGYSEIGWTPTSQRSWDEYKVRLGKHKARLDAKNIGFYKSKFVDWQ